MFLLSLLRRLFDAASTIVLVTAAAAFIWLFAEQKTVHDQTALEIELDYGTSAQQKDLFILPHGAPHKVLVTFRSSNKVADDIKAELARLPQGTPFHIPLEIKADADAQDIKFSLRERLEKHLFAKYAASNIQVDQNPQVEVTVEKLKTLELPLKVDASQVETVADVDLGTTPATVTVRLPANLAARWAQRNSVTANDVTASARLGKPGIGVKIGEKVSRQVPVEIEALDIYCAQNPERKQEILRHLLVSPATVPASFTLNKTTSADLRLTRPVPVTVSAPPSILNDWNIAIPMDDEKFLKELRLACTDEVRDLILKNEGNLAKGADGVTPLVWAVVRVTSDEKLRTSPNGILTLDLEVMTPPGASVSPTFVLPKTITVKATRRNP